MDETKSARRKMGGLEDGMTAGWTVRSSVVWRLSERCVSRHQEMTGNKRDAVLM
jgi:hypothetical protein